MARAAFFAVHLMVFFNIASRCGQSCCGQSLKWLCLSFFLSPFSVGILDEDSQGTFFPVTFACKKKKQRNRLLLLPIVIIGCPVLWILPLCQESFAKKHAKKLAPYLWMSYPPVTFCCDVFLQKMQKKTRHLILWMSSPLWESLRQECEKIWRPVNTPPGHAILFVDIFATGKCYPLTSLVTKWPAIFARSECKKKTALYPFPCDMMLWIFMPRKLAYPALPLLWFLFARN